MSMDRGAEQESGADRGLRSSADPVESLAGILGLRVPESVTESGPDWSAVEAALGAVLPSDYKRFVEMYGAGSIDDHLTVHAPGAPSWADLVSHNGEAEETVRVDFGGPENDSGDWHLGDASQWDPERRDVPSWFESGDDLVSWAVPTTVTSCSGISSLACQPTSGRWWSRRRGRTGSSTVLASRRLLSACSRARSDRSTSAAGWKAPTSTPRCPIRKPHWVDVRPVACACGSSTPCRCPRG